MHPRLLSGCAVLGLCPVAVAQRWFDEPIRGHLTAEYEATLAFAAGDIDGDGDLDLVSAGENAARLCRNDGQLRFTRVGDRLPAPAELRVDPATLVTLPWIVLPAPSVAASLRWTFPNDSRLVGVELFAQALFVDPERRAHLGELVVDRIR